MMHGTYSVKVNLCCYCIITWCHSSSVINIRWKRTYVSKFKASVTVSTLFAKEGLGMRLSLHSASVDPAYQLCKFLKKPSADYKGADMWAQCADERAHVVPQPCEIWGHTRVCEECFLVRCNTVYSGAFQSSHLNVYQPTCCHVPVDRGLISSPFFNTWLQTSVSHATPKLKSWTLSLYMRWRRMWDSRCSSVHS